MFIVSTLSGNADLKCRYKLQDFGAQVEGHACACPGATTSIDGSGG